MGSSVATTVPALFLRVSLISRSGLVGDGAAENVVRPAATLKLNTSTSAAVLITPSIVAGAADTKVAVAVVFP